MKINLKHVISKLIFLLILNLLLTFQSQGQVLISRNSGDYYQDTHFENCSGGVCSWIVLKPDARFNQLFYFTIPTFHSIDSCGLNSITSNPSGLIFELDTFQTCNQIRLLVTGGWVETAGYDHYVEFNYHAKNKTTFPAIDNQTFKIQLVRDTSKIVMVLDRSGSMDWLIPNTSVRRWDTLETAVNVFTYKLEEFRKYGDSLGLTYFATDVIQPSNTYFPNDFIAITSNPFNPSSSTNKVKNELATVIKPEGWTAMGRGLLDAKRKLNQIHTVNTKKMVLLVTDGEQNWHELVDPNGVSVGGGIDSLNNYSINPRDSILYYIIATWEAGDAPEILNAIAENSGGEALNSIPSEFSSFDALFDDHLENMLYENSPQIILKKEADNLTSSITHSFNLNAHIPTLLFHLSTFDIDISITKNGDDITSLAQELPEEPDFNMNTFHFPIIKETDTIKSEGNWEVTLTGNSSNPYYLSAIADDHYLDYTCKLNKKIFTVGDIIKFNTHISYIEEPVTGSNVKAYILKPSDDIGHLLSIYETSLCDTTDDDISNPVSQKYANLMLSDTTFFNALLPDKQEVILTDLGNGNYSGQFHHTDISGPYNIIFLINGEIPDNGKFDRFKMISSIVVSDGANSDIDIFADVETPSTPTDLHTDNVTETSLKLKWNPSSDDFGIDKYIIYQNGENISEVNFNKCHYNIYHLAPATNYSFYIQARDASGLISENSNSVNITTLGDVDNEQPSIPSNLAASNITQTHAYLSWDYSIDNIEVTKYEIYRDGEIINNTSSTSAYVQNLVADTEYTLYVLAKDASGNISGSSNTINIQTLENPDTENPLAPTNLSALNITQTTLYLNWDIPCDNKGVTEYNVYENNIFLVSTNTNELFRANLAPNTSYSYYINAKDAAGNISENSDVINITTLGIVDTIAPATPTNLIASNIAHSSLYLSWNESTDNVGTILYYIYQNNNLLTSVTNTNYSVTDLVPGTDYSFYVIAKDAAGNVSDNSNIIDVSTLGIPDTEPPTTPGNLTVTNIGQSTIYLSWNESIDNTGVDKYIIYQNGNAISSTSAISKSIIGLNSNTTYSFYIIAKDIANNQSAVSNEISVTTLEKSDVLSAPSRLTASNITQTSFKLNWNASSGNIGEVEYGVFLDGTLIDKTSNTNYIVTGLRASNSYKVHLIAKDSRRNFSDASKTVKIVTLDRFVLTPKDFYKIVGIKIRPKNKFGKYMGPGFESKIKFEYKPKKPRDPIAHKTSLNDESQERMVHNPEPYLKNIQDNLDGSYYLILGNVAPKTNPDIKITVRDNTLYEGSLYRIPLWFYIILIITIVIILLLLIVKLKQTKLYKFMWILLIVLLLIWLLHYTGQLFFLYMI